MTEIPSDNTAPNIGITLAVLALGIVTIGTGCFMLGYIVRSTTGCM